MKSRTQLKLKDVVRNEQGQIIEMEVFDVSRRDGFTMARIEDIHGDIVDVEIEMSDGKHIEGQVNLTKYRRVSDLFAYGKQFQPIINAKVNGKPRGVFFINKAFVVGAQEIPH